MWNCWRACSALVIGLLLAAPAAAQINVSGQIVLQLDDFDAITGWAVYSDDAANIATDLNHVEGTNSLEFDKVDGVGNTVYALIDKTITSQNLSICASVGSLQLKTYVKLPAVDDVLNLVVRLGTDDANYNEWRYDATHLVENRWETINIRLSNAYDAQAGNGWAQAAVTYLAVGVEFDSESATLTDILWDSVEALCTNDLAISALPVGDNKIGNIGTDFDTLDSADSTTGWSACDVDTINLTTSTESMEGEFSLSFDKADGAANSTAACIEKTLSRSVNLTSKGGIGSLIGLVPFNIPTLTNVSSVEIRLGEDSSNYNTWRFSTTGLTADTWIGKQWRLAESAITPTGAGWTPSSIDYIAYVVNFSAETDTLAGILFDAFIVNYTARTSDVSEEILKAIQSAQEDSSDSLSAIQSGLSTAAVLDELSPTSGPMLFGDTVTFSAATPFSTLVTGDNDSAYHRISPQGVPYSTLVSTDGAQLTFPVAAALSDTMTNPTTTLVGSANLKWNNAQEWEREAARESIGYSTVSTAAMLAVNVRAAAGVVVGWSCTSVATGTVYARLVNKATAPDPSADDSALILRRMLIAGTYGSFTETFEEGIEFSAGISIAATEVALATDTDETALTAGEVACNVNYYYR